MDTDTPLRKFRKDTGKTPEQIAGLIGVNRATLYRWESGEIAIPVKRLADVEKLTGIPREKLRPDIFAGGA